MAELVYMLCVLTSVAVMVLLLRGYLRSRVRLLLWSSLCFAGLATNNILLLLDLFVVPQMDLRPLRDLAALGGLSLLLYGVIWDMKA